MMTGCINLEQEETNLKPSQSPQKAETHIVEKQPPTAVKSATDQIKDGQTAFSKLFQDKYENNLGYLEKSKRDIQESVGKPDEAGWYEGGEFLQYGSFTYFINPDTKAAESMAVQDVSLDKADVNDSLGSADKRYENKMEGLWTEEYYYDDGTIVVERPSESSDEVVCIWFHK